MGKISAAKKKAKRKDFQKVKFKVGKKLPKNLNETKATFQVFKFFFCWHLFYCSTYSVYFPGQNSNNQKAISARERRSSVAQKLVMESK
jgi:hypothetical protein